MSLLRCLCDFFKRIFGGERANLPAPAAANIGQIVAEIRNTIAHVGKEAGVPPFQSAEITLQTLISSAVQGEAQAFIVTLSDKVEHEQTHQIALTIGPPKPSFADTQFEFSQELKEAIVAAVRAVQNALQKQLALELNKVVASVTFVARTTGSAKLGGKVELVPLTLSLGGTISRAAQHKVQLTFSNP